VDNQGAPAGHPTFTFTLYLDREPAAAEIDALFGAGCDDAAFGSAPGEWTAVFDRQADSYAAAVASARQAVEALGPRVLRVQQGDTAGTAGTEEGK
jgi:hypothetical protein